MTTQLRLENTDGRRIAIYRDGAAAPLLVQQADADSRPFIHPITAPDGHGVLTENAPSHHPWQHGLYIGLNDVNGWGFWEEGLRGKPADGTFHPRPIDVLGVDGSTAAWRVTTDWREPGDADLLTELQTWRLSDRGDAYELDLEWTLTASQDIQFGAYAYGGLFLRMPFRKEHGGQFLNSEGLHNQEGEGKRARWGAVSMPIDGRSGHAGIAIMDHPANAEHPSPWRVDWELGISPSRCIAGAWALAKGESCTYRYRLNIFIGETLRDTMEANWSRYIREADLA